MLAQLPSHSKQEIEAVLAELDSAIAHKKEYQAARLVRADSIERVVNTCHPNVYVEKCKELYDAVADFDGKRSLKALARIEKTPQYQQDMNLRAWTDLNASRTYGTMGLYHKANNITNSIDPNKLSVDERLHYYYTSQSNYEKIAEYMSDISVVQDEEKQMVTYYDSILSLLPEGSGRGMAIAYKEVYLNHPQVAMDAIEPYFKQATGKERVYMSAVLAAIYELLNDRQNYIYYLAITSVADIKNGTTEYQALSYLVHALYREGDINRAYAYLMCTMEDANTFPSRSIALDVSKYFPLINTAYSSHREDLIKSDKQKRNSLAMTFALLALSICVAFYLGWHQNNAAEQKKRADELQKALDRATIADRVKTVFIQNMRHEIRTPLNAIMGFAQLMSNDLTDEERDLYNGYIMESNNQLLSTLDDIIDVSNMEVGAFNFHFGDVDVDTLCKEKMEDAKEFLPAGVEYLYAPSTNGLHLQSDPKRVGQVLHNLLTNACKNTTTGSITLGVRHNAAKDSIEFVVTDTGCGIPPDKTDVIFEHFEKLDHYSPGLGLGLYVCRLIARALGGDIYLDTEYTTGARFVFTVPNHTAPQEEESQAANGEETQKYGVSHASLQL